MVRRPRGQGARSVFVQRGRFGFGLFVYLVLTILVFAVVGRYMPHIARRVGHIRHGWLRFGIYFVVYVCLMLGSKWLVHHPLLRLRREGALRLCFIAGTILSIAVAIYQNRFGTGLSATYCMVGILGAFVGVLFVTKMTFGLIEVVAPPSAAMIADVEHAHQGLRLANHLFDRAKRGVELALALALIILSLPISVILAMIIWLQDPGPLLVAKIAVTRGGKSFRQLKLRSMIKNAEGATGAVPARPDDARITPFGQLLRRTHIDELPQMLNIAIGDMSLVGPRPDRTVFAQRNIRTLPDYPLRHTVRPGLSGLAQVYGDYYSTAREKLRYDLLYIRRRSPGLDTRLLLAATLLGLFGIAPQMNRGRRLFTERRKEDRWRRAHEALRGDTPDAPTAARVPVIRSEAALTGRLDRTVETHAHLDR
ncbi:MAG: sugar transferase [Thermomicrobia bacterium]|nr:sugar transferase [Thermomicrobia bacterium]